MSKTSKQLTPRKKASILAYHDVGMSNVSIAKKLHFTEGPIRKFLQRAKSGEINRRKGSGRPRLSGEEEDDVLVDLSLDDPFKTAPDLRTDWAKETGVEASTRTVRRRLVENALPARKPRRKPLMKEATRAKRLAFAREHKNWTAEDWSRVIFSDETWAQLFENGGKRWVRRPPGEALGPKFILPTVKHPEKVMCWGAITPNAKSKLVFIDGDVDADKYIEVLKEANLKRFVRQHPDPNPVLMEDGAGPHRARKTQEWHRRNGISVLPSWPGYSPDLNPIENCWSLMKLQLSKCKPTTVAGIKEVMQKIWKNLTTDYLRSLYESMPRRMQMVIAAEGGATKY